jgi:hypothetical protein
MHGLRISGRRAAVGFRDVFQSLKQPKENFSLGSGRK